MTGVLGERFQRRFPVALSPLNASALPHECPSIPFPGGIGGGPKPDLLRLGIDSLNRWKHEAAQPEGFQPSHTSVTLPNQTDDPAQDLRCMNLTGKAARSRQDLAGQFGTRFPPRHRQQWLH